MTAECVLCGDAVFDIPEEEVADAICVGCGLDALERHES